MKYAVPVLLALSLGIACNRTESKAAANQAPATGAAATQAATPAAPGAPGAQAGPQTPPPAPVKPVPAV